MRKMYFFQASCNKYKNLTTSKCLKFEQVWISDTQTALFQHSTETATTSIFAILNRLFEKKKKVILITLDISAAFDLLDKFNFDTKIEGSWISRENNFNL